MKENSSLRKEQRTMVGPPIDDVTRVWHSQMIRQSLNYHSVECSYGVTLVADNNSSAIKKQIKKAEELVEEFLTKKFEQQKQLLEAISRGR
jgi:hypothetical protein